MSLNMKISKLQIESYYFGNPRYIADKILFIKRDTRLNEYREHLTEIDTFGNVWHGITGLLRGQKITIIVAGIGPSMIGDAVYALDKQDSVCLYSGTCGGLHEDLQIGDYFIADHAICGDGFTFHLGHTPLQEISGDLNLLDSLKHQIIGKADRSFSGTAFTTSSVVRETDADFWKVVDKKCGAIEMAASAFYAASAATQKRAAAYFWVSDLPTRGKSFVESFDPQDIDNKQNRYDHSVDFDLELIASV
jgi:purine-nucleoside phosphorylase